MCNYMLVLPCGPDPISIGYLLPTRDAITLHRPEAAPLPATNAGTAEGAAGWISSYLDAGARHVVLRPADENSEGGLEAAADVRERLAAALSEVA